MSDSADEQVAEVQPASAEPPPEDRVDPAAKRDQLVQDSEPLSVVDAPHRYKSLYFKRYKATTVLLVLFILTIVGALLFYPRRSSVYRPPALSILINVVNGKALGPGIAVTPIGADLFRISIFISAVAPPKATMQRFLNTSVVVYLPSGDTPEHCRLQSIPGPGCNFTSALNTYTLTSATNNLSYTEGYHNGLYYQGHNIWDMSFYFTVRAPSLAWDANGVSLEAQLPVVTLSQSYITHTSPTAQKARILQVPGSTNVTVNYAVPDATDYDWTGGPTPSSVTPPTASISDYLATWN